MRTGWKPKHLRNDWRKQGNWKQAAQQRQTGTIKCGHCDAAFWSESSLTEHLSLVHDLGIGLHRLRANIRQAQNDGG